MNEILRSTGGGTHFNTKNYRKYGNTYTPVSPRTAADTMIHTNGAGKMISAPGFI